MNLFQVVITAVLTTLAVLALGVAAVWSLWPSSAEASAAIAAHSGTWHSAGHGEEGTANHCGKLSSLHLEMGEAVVTAALKLDEAQQQALEPVAQALERWRARAQQTCEQTRFDDLDSGLAGLETMLDQGAEAVAELRPAVTGFYATLSAEQQNKLHDFVHNHRRMHRRTFH